MVRITALEKIKSLQGSELIGHVGTKQEKYPFYKVTRGKCKEILLSGSVHGDEPAGMYALISFFQNDIKNYENDFKFTAFPCVNPWGHVHYKRGNHQHLNLNREFHAETKATENKLIMSHLDNYLVTMDFHETMTEWERVGDEPEGEDATEFYLWEICENKKIRIGDKIVQNLEKENIPVCKMPEIYDDINNGGVIWYPEGCKNPCYAKPSIFDSYLSINHAPQVFTIETARDEQTMSQRINAHLISLKTVLNSKR